MPLNAKELLEDRNFQNMLAGVGAGLDPQGIGGVVGNASIMMNKANAAKETVLKDEAKRKDFLSQLREIIGGGMTAKELPGLTSANITGNEVTLKGTLPEQEQSQGQTSPNESRNKLLMDLIPF